MKTIVLKRIINKAASFLSGVALGILILVVIVFIASEPTRNANLLNDIALERALGSKDTNKAIELSFEATACQGHWPCNALINQHDAVQSQEMDLFLDSNGVDSGNVDVYHLHDSYHPELMVSALTSWLPGLGLDGVVIESNGTEKYQLLSLDELKSSPAKALHKVTNSANTPHSEEGDIDKGVRYYLIDFFLKVTTGIGNSEWIKKVKEIEGTFDSRVKIYAYRTKNKEG